MIVRLGYKDKLVYVESGRVYLFKGKLYSAPLEEVIRAAYSEDALVPPDIREIAHDLTYVFRVIPAINEEKQAITGPFRQKIHA